MFNSLKYAWDRASKEGQEAFVVGLIILGIAEALLLIGLGITLYLGFTLDIGFFLVSCACFAFILVFGFVALSDCGDFIRDPEYFARF